MPQAMENPTQTGPTMEKMLAAGTGAQTRGTCVGSVLCLVPVCHPQERPRSSQTPHTQTCHQGKGVSLGTPWKRGLGSSVTEGPLRSTLTG